MSFVFVSPDVVAAASRNLAGVGSAISQAHAAAAPMTTSVVAAAGDEVSASVAALFSEHGAAFQAAGAQAAAFHSHFVHALTSSGGRYAVAEAASAAPLEALIYPSLETLIASASGPYGSVGPGGVGGAGGLRQQTPGDIYVVNQGSNSVSVINPAGTLVATIAVGANPYGVAVK